MKRNIIELGSNNGSEVSGKYSFFPKEQRKNLEDLSELIRKDAIQSDIKERKSMELVKEFFVI